jgi:excisionase family DNA binding protein
VGNERGRCAVVVDLEVAGGERECVTRQAYSAEEFRTLFGIPRSTFQELLKRGELPVKPIRMGGTWRFPKPVVDRMLGIEG